MIDGVVKDGILEAIRFLKPGARGDFVVNGHQFAIVARDTRGLYLVTCESCGLLFSTNTSKPYLAIHDHVKADDVFDKDRSRA